MDINSLLNKFKLFVLESIRVLRLTKKPDKIEFKTIVKASAIGILIIGIIGFIIQMAKLIFL